MFRGRKSPEKAESTDGHGVVVSMDEFYRLSNMSPPDDVVGHQPKEVIYYGPPVLLADSRIPRKSPSQHELELASELAKIAREHFNS